MAVIQPILTHLKGGQPVVIESAAENDAAELLACLRRNLEDGEGMVLLPEELTRTEEKQREWLRDLRAGAGSIVLVGRVDGKIVGALDLTQPKNKRFAHTSVLAITILPEFRRQGLGSILMDTMVRWAQTVPEVEKINLAVYASHARAIALYSKFGFVEEGRKRREVKVREGVYEDNLLMARILR